MDIGEHRRRGTMTHFGVALPDLLPVLLVPCRLLHTITGDGPVAHQVAPLVLHHHHVDALHVFILQGIQVTPDLSGGGWGG